MMERKIVLYTTGCPKCRVLEKLMNQKEIKFEVETNKDVLVEKGFQQVPMLEVDGVIMDFGLAFRWASLQK